MIADMLTTGLPREQIVKLRELSGVHKLNWAVIKWEKWGVLTNALGYCNLLTVLEFKAFRMFNRMMKHEVACTFRHLAFSSDGLINSTQTCKLGKIFFSASRLIHSKMRRNVREIRRNTIVIVFCHFLLMPLVDLEGYGWPFKVMKKESDKGAFWKYWIWLHAGMLHNLESHLSKFRSKPKNGHRNCTLHNFNPCCATLMISDIQCWYFEYS